MSLENPVTKNLRDASLVISDGGANTLNVDAVCIEEGDLTYTEPGPPARQVMDRGALSHLRPGDEEPVTGSMTLKFNQLIQQSGATNPTVYEALTQTGAASGWTTTIGDGGGVYTVQLAVTINDPDPNNSDEKITFAYLHVENVEFSEGDEYNTLSFDFIDWEVAASASKV